MARTGRVWVGHWRYTADFERPFAAGTADDNDGWYVGAERDFKMGALVGAAFVRIGTADKSLNALQNYFGAGVVFDSPIEGRPEDQFGLAVASAVAGGPYRETLAESGAKPAARETTWEFTYRAPLNRHLVVQPDLQYVHHPAANASIDDALVFALRFELSF